ncbi:uncharacterized protein LOC113371249 [Ctenocephalides felis]|uniref:uncharacterized protein LOC113371249 n=1 Tax=Ctenocephalides felis TaxID=7515 RepID=UPI000E6E5153|nr:uncharacterized protein LOC113371249 [Ctenocephalides felis]
MAEANVVELKEKIIDFVSKHECIYDRYHMHYRNRFINDPLWNKISSELNISTMAARQYWRTLRRGYINYRRARKQNLHIGKYPWAAHLSFLDKTLDSIEQFNDCAKKQIYSDVVDSLITSSQTEQITHTTKPSSKPNINHSNTFDEMSDFFKGVELNHEEVMNKLRNSNTQKLDSVDYLFLSYAQTFKQFSLERQATLKVDLATLFSEAELYEIDESNNDLELDDQFEVIEN